jgi:Macrocin-O-methyltransferase (TylF)
MWDVACGPAVSDYRKKMDITDDIITVDDAAVYWRKSTPALVA